MTLRRGGRAWVTERAQFLATTDETHCWFTDWCGGQYVDRTLPGTHRWGPTVHHEVELMRGGPELVRDGAVLHLAHNWCNAADSNRLRARVKPVPARPTSRDW